MNKVFFHIGLHKTGTTFLQRSYFNTLSLKYIHGAKPFYQIIEEISQTESKIVLISSENLSGNLFSTNYLNDFEKNIKTIKKIFGDVGVIIGFRKHTEFLLSAYKQALQQGNTINLKDFFNEKNKGLLRHQDLNYSHRIKLLKKEFTNVFIYTIDDIKDLNALNKSLCEFLEIKPNQIKQENKKLNVGIQTVFQVRLLVTLNKMDITLFKILRFKIFYSKLFKFLKITPRKICQYYIPDFGKKYTLPSNLFYYIESKYHDDWQYVLNQKSIKKN